MKKSLFIGQKVKDEGSKVLFAGVFMFVGNGFSNEKPQISTGRFYYLLFALCSVLCSLCSVLCALYSYFTLSATCNSRRQFVLSVLLSVKRTKTPVTRAV